MFIALFALLFGFNVQAQSEAPLPIYIFELKPLFYMDDDKQIKGEWLKSFDALSKKSGIKFEYVFVSVPRMELLLKGPRPGCNLTLLRNNKREESINFIYDHKEPSRLKVYQRGDDKRQLSLKYLQENKKLKIITNSSVIKEILSEKNIKSEILFNMNSILHMLLIKRIDAFVGTNLAVEKMERFKNGQLRAGITVKTLTHGIGCSRGTPDIITDKLKHAAKNWEL